MPFGKSAVMALTGVSRIQLDHWAQKGIIRPSVKAASGRGTRKEYSVRDLVQLRVAKKLRDEGISLPKIRNVLVNLRKELKIEIQIDTWTKNKDLRYLTDGDNLFIITKDPQSTWDALKHKFIISLSIGDIINDLYEELKKFVDKREDKVIILGREFTIIYTPDLVDGGYTVQCKELPAAISQGYTEQEALDNIIDALELCLETEREMLSGKNQAR